MADPQKEAIQLMAEEVVRAIRKITDENNRNYVNTQIRNSKTNTVISGGDVYASDVIGLYPAVAGYIANAPDAAEQGDPNATRIVLTMNGLADLQIQSATIDTAQIDNLYGSYAEFLHTVADTSVIGDADIQKARIALADIGLLVVSNANIGYGQIKDLTAGTAIITEGAAGKLKIDRLTVDQAQIAGLEVGELIIESNVDHKLYRIDVDAQGNVTAVLRPITGGANGDIGSGTIIGANIANSTITNGLIQDGTIKVAKLDVGDFFASQAIIPQLTTTIIESQDFEDGVDDAIESNSSIALTNQRLALVVDVDHTTASSLVLTQTMLDAVADNIDLEANNSVRITSAGQISVDAATNLNLGSNTSVTIHSDDQIASSAMNSIVSSVVNSQGITAISQQANRIDLIVAHASTSDNVIITDAAISAIEDQITIQASKINAIADQLDLSGNNSVQIYSGGQLSATARAGMDLSANNSIKITSGDQISVEAIQGIDLTANGEIKLLSDTNIILNEWFKFGETFQVSKPDSNWYTETSGAGFYVKNKQLEQAIAAFEGLAAKVQSLIVGNNANLRVIDDGNGGMAWVDM